MNRRASGKSRDSASCTNLATVMHAQGCTGAVRLDAAKARFPLLDKRPAGFFGVFRTLQDCTGI